jgi:hypothetical protein
MARGGIGASLLLLALGAILTWAVTVEAEGFNINTIGLILLAVGGLGLIISLVAEFASPASSDSQKDVTIIER